MDLYQPDFSETYRELGDVSLRLHGFRPRQGAPTGTAIVFFFGGGWTGGTPVQFFPHCIGLAARGATCFAAEYRVKGAHGTTPFECVADAKAAIRWLRRNAERLGFAPDRIVAGGGSAGGHLAACAALVPWEEDGADTSESCVPEALLLFNALLDATTSPVNLQEALTPNLTPSTQGQTVNDPYLYIEFILKTDSQNATPKLSITTGVTRLGL